TPETLAIATEAARRGCRLAGIGAEGSPLHRIAEQARAPFVPVVSPGLPRGSAEGVSSPEPTLRGGAGGSSSPEPTLRGGAGGSSPPEPTLPRSMLWAVAVPLLVMAERIGVARIGSDVYELAASRLEEVSHQCRPASESFVNPGKSLALDLVGELPMVLGTPVLSAVPQPMGSSPTRTRAKIGRAHV